MANDIAKRRRAKSKEWGGCVHLIHTLTYRTQWWWYTHFRPDNINNIHRDKMQILNSERWQWKKWRQDRTVRENYGAAIERKRERESGRKRENQDKKQQVVKNEQLEEPLQLQRKCTWSFFIIGMSASSWLCPVMYCVWMYVCMSVYILFKFFSFYFGFQ